MVTSISGPDLPASTNSGSERSFDLDRPLREARNEFERSYFAFHLAQEGGSMTRVSARVGIERTHLYRKLKQLVSIWAPTEPGGLQLRSAARAGFAVRRCRKLVMDGFHRREGRVQLTCHAAYKAELEWLYGEIASSQARRHNSLDGGAARDERGLAMLAAYGSRCHLSDPGRAQPRRLRQHLAPRCRDPQLMLEGCPGILRKHGLKTLW